MLKPSRYVCMYVCITKTNSSQYSLPINNDNLLNEANICVSDASLRLIGR